MSASASLNVAEELRPKLVRAYRRRFIHQRKGQAYDEFGLLLEREQFESALVAMHSAPCQLFNPPLVAPRPCLLPFASSLSY